MELRDEELCDDGTSTKDVCNGGYELAEQRWVRVKVVCGVIRKLSKWLHFQGSFLLQAKEQQSFKTFEIVENWFEQRFVLLRRNKGCFPFVQTFQFKCPSGPFTGFFPKLKIHA